MAIDLSGVLGAYAAVARPIMRRVAVEIVQAVRRQMAAAGKVV